MEDRLSQKEVEHEANAVRYNDRERRPGNRWHIAPHCICVNIAREKKVSAGKRAARQTDQGPEADRAMIVESPEEEGYEGQSSHNPGRTWNDTESAPPAHVVCPLLSEYSPKSLLRKSGSNESRRDGSNQNAANPNCHTWPGRFHRLASHAKVCHAAADPADVKNIATPVPIQRLFACHSVDLISSARLRTAFSTRSAAVGSSSIANQSSARTARAESSAYLPHSAHFPK